MLWHLAVSRSDVSAIGDLAFGVGVFFFSGDITLVKFGLFFLITILSSAILFNFIVVTQSIVFWLGNFESAAQQFFDILLGLELYPQSIYSGVLKVLTFTIFPVFFIVGLPVEIVRNFNFVYILYMLGFWAVTFILAIWVFNKGLKRYESGNLINVRV